MRNIKDIIKEIAEHIINPRLKEKPRLDLRNELTLKFNKSLYLKDYLKTQAWLDFYKPIIFGSIESGIERLLRDGMTMNETELKAILSDMRANLNLIIETRHAIETGEEAGAKLESLKE